MISGDLGVNLDPRSAQSSITHIITGNGSFGKKLASFCERMERSERNKTTEILTNHLADRFFEKHISSKINIKKLQNDVGSYIFAANNMPEKRSPLMSYYK
nr:hypothetical protein [Escherichia albertii]